MKIASESNTSDMQTCDLVKASHHVKTHWGYDTLSGSQSKAIEAILEEQDSLVLLPTAGGKSLIFQAAALCFDGTAVVISPLISLMNDQVKRLRSCGIAARTIHDQIHDNERRRIISELKKAGAVRLLYLSPEMALDSRVLDSVRVSFFAVDECHCVTWSEFRPEYARLAELRQRFPDAAMHGFTATARPKLREEIVRRLGLREPVVIAESMQRHNLQFSASVTATFYDTKVVDYVRSRERDRGIVYCITRKMTDGVYDTMREWGIRCVKYHAGMDDEARGRAQDDWLAGKARTMVATNAFGLGIDSPDVRYVLHAQMPKSLDEYVQQAGRSGRDGEPADCHLMFDYRSLATWSRMLALDDTVQLDLVEDVRRYALSGECRTKYLMRYFGERLELPCGSCDNCLKQTELDRFDLLCRW